MRTTWYSIEYHVNIIVKQISGIQYVLWHTIISVLCKGYGKYIFAIII